MGVLNFFLIFILFSCSKISYITKQGYGQLALEVNGVDNKKVLRDKNVKEVYKDKIRKISKYKDYFYKYFDKKPNSIYTETTFLDRKAVSYLVIASKFNEVKALKTSFPFVGDFPYLGFYSLDDAKEYKESLESREYYTYLRPVQAYSTLNKLFFKDNILSTFFEYSDFNLADLIFHELTHTIFFVESNVGFNESLADYIAFEMTKEYFKISESEFSMKQLKKEKFKKLSKLINKLVLEYKSRIKEARPKVKAESDKLLKSFLEDDFMKKVKEMCFNLKLKKCWPLQKKWNNASFTAFLTYNSKKNIIAKIRTKNNLDLVGLIKFLELKKEEFEDSDSEDFVKFLSI